MATPDNINPTEFLNIDKDDNAKVKSTAIKLPIKAHNVIVFDVFPKNKIAKAAPALAEELIPIISGDARGFENNVWNIRPQHPNPKPAINAVKVRGILKFNKTFKDKESPANNFSKETRQLNNYVVPCAILLTDVSVAGE